MLVYGDCSWLETGEALVGNLREALGEADRDSLDDLRRLLIQTGRLEQAAMDAGVNGAYERITDLAATAFCECFRHPGTGLQKPSLHELDRELAAIKTTREKLRVKEPEGFTFYALFPEQYCVSAQRWSDEHRGQRGTVLVIGIRSIGTTLSAVVASVLNAEGWETKRLSVRPSGNPSERTVCFQPPDSDWALVVDEGPGLSGSSMAAVAEALGRRRIAFFPGHHNGPGPMAAKKVRLCWAQTPQYTTRLSRVRWGGRPLRELLGGGGRLADIREGKWREQLFDSEKTWPAAALMFERAKYLHASAGTLYKFNGFMARGSRFGFVGSRWIQGRALNAADGQNPEIAALIEKSISRGPSLGQTEARAGMERLTRMLVGNTREALGEDLGRRAQQLADASGSVVRLPRSVDGHMSPHEWIRDFAGTIHKVGNHAHDHTVIGTQPFLWDVAGACVEWDMEELPSARNLPQRLFVFGAQRMRHSEWDKCRCASKRWQRRIRNKSAWAGLLRDIGRC